MSKSSSLHIAESLCKTLVSFVSRAFSFLFAQRADHGPGAGDVQHQVHPLVRHLGPPAGEAQPCRLAVPPADAALVRPGSPGESSTFSSSLKKGKKKSPTTPAPIPSSHWRSHLVSACLFQSISGLRLTDTFLKRTYEYDDMAQVCVICPYTSNES